MVKMTRFERARVITARALQLSFAAPPLVKTESGMTAFGLAEKELAEGVLPLVVIRRFPDGRTERLAI